MNINWNQILEDAIIGKVVTALVDDGFRLETSPQAGGGSYIYAVENGGKKPPEGFDFWVCIVPGNGTSVISDYSVNLEETLKPVNEFAAQFEEEG